MEVHDPPLFDIAPPLVITIIWNSTEVPILISTKKKKKNLSMLLLLNKSHDNAYCDFWRPTPISSYYVFSWIGFGTFYYEKRKRKRKSYVAFTLASNQHKQIILIFSFAYFFFFYSPLNHYFDTIIKFLNLIKMAHLKGYYELFWNMGQRLRNKILLIPKKLKWCKKREEKINEKQEN